MRKTMKELFDEFLFELISTGEGILILIICFILLVSGVCKAVAWIGTWSTFDDRVTEEITFVQIPVEFILNYQTTPQVVYETMVIQGELEHKTVKSWNGDLIREECVISVQINSDKVNNLIGTANAILSAARLPLQYQQRGVAFSKPIDCNATDYSQKVYIEVTGAEGSGDLLYIRKGGFDHEEAFVTLPRNLYDLVLLAAVNGTQFQMPNYAQAGWFRGQTLATVTYEAGDPNGLNAWVQSWLPAMSIAYGTNLAATSPETVEVEVIVRYKTVETGSGHRECTVRIKGNCKKEEWIADTKQVPVTEMRQVTTVEYYIP